MKPYQRLAAGRKRPSVRPPTVAAPMPDPIQPPRPRFPSEDEIVLRAARAYGTSFARFNRWHSGRAPLPPIAMPTPPAKRSASGRAWSVTETEQEMRDGQGEQRIVEGSLVQRSPSPHQEQRILSGGASSAPSRPGAPENQSRRSLLGLMATGAGVVVIGSIVAGWLVTPNTLFSPSEPPASFDYALQGTPTITPTHIDQVLASYNSPAQSQGQVLYDLGVRYEIDPIFALAFFMHESTFGRNGWAHTNRSLGNIRCSQGYACGGGYRAYDTWEAGFEDWYRLIRDLYIGQWGLKTVGQIVPRYAPAADHNDEAGYIAKVTYAVDCWRSGKVVVE